MKPQALVAAESGDRGEVVDGPGVHRAGGRDDDARLDAVRAILRDPVREITQRQAEILVDRLPPDLTAAVPIAYSPLMHSTRINGLRLTAPAL